MLESCRRHAQCTRQPADARLTNLLAGFATLDRADRDSREEGKFPLGQGTRVTYLAQSWHEHGSIISNIN